MSTKQILKAYSMVLGISGIALVWVGAGWMAAAGLFLALWASNIENHLRSPTTQAGGGANNP